MGEASSIQRKAHLRMPKEIAWILGTRVAVVVEFRALRTRHLLVDLRCDARPLAQVTRVI